MACQQSLDLCVEDFSVKEKLIIRRLKEYYTIDPDIRLQERIISGELTRCLPSLSPPPTPEDEPSVMAALRTQQMSEEREYMVKVVETRVNLSGDKYADRFRVASRLQKIQGNDEKEEQAIQDAYMILTERQSEQYLKLTQAERYASDREKEVEDATKECDRLVTLRDIITPALEDMYEYYPEWWTILWNKYVLNLHWKEVCKKAARNGIALTPEEYRLSRQKALHQFDKWAVGLA